MTFNLKQKIINFADGLLKYLAKKICPARPASCPVNIKPGLTNAPITEKKLFAGLSVFYLMPFYSHGFMSAGLSDNILCVPFLPANHWSLVNAGSHQTLVSGKRSSWKYSTCLDSQKESLNFTIFENFFEQSVQTFAKQVLFLVASSKLSNVSVKFLISCVIF